MDDQENEKSAIILGRNIVEPKTNDVKEMPVFIIRVIRWIFLITGVLVLVLCVVVTVLLLSDRNQSHRIDQLETELAVVFSTLNAPTWTPTPTATATVTPSPTTAVPTLTPTPPTPSETPTPTPTATETPSPTPTLVGGCPGNATGVIIIYTNSSALVEAGSLPPNIDLRIVGQFTLDGTEYYQFRRADGQDYFLTRSQFVELDSSNCHIPIVTPPP